MKYDQIAEAYIASTKLKQKSIPCVDISHHRNKSDLCENTLHNWINDGKHTDIDVHSIEYPQHDYYSDQDEYPDLVQEHIRNLNQHHTDAIRAYIHGGLDVGHDTGSIVVNTNLIGAYNRNVPIQKVHNFGKHVLHIDHLDDALQQNKLKHSLTTYSGIGFDPVDVMKNGMLHLPAYTSSSTNKSVALEYAHAINNRYHILQIHHPTGSTGVYLGDNHDYTPFNQKEHIMPRGVTLSIDSTPDVYTDSEGKKIHVWKAKRLLSLEKK